MREQIANEMWRVLRPGGTILCYDLRPAPYVVGLFFMPYYALRRILGVFTSRPKKISDVLGKPHHSTPIRPIPITEVKKMFSRGVMRYSAVSLNFNLCRIAGKSFFLATILSCMPFLRSHYLALIRKPT